MLKEFKEFAFKGNMIDMAIGLIMGGAFGTVVKSLVDDVFMPMIAAVTGGKVDFTDKFYDFGKNFESLQSAKEAGAPVIGYGSFLTALISFFILALVVFIFIKKFMGSMAKALEDEKEKEEPSAQEVLLAEIRDLLKEKA